MTIDKATEERCYIIAEIGACHQGSLRTAMTMIDHAAAAGVDAVKGQMRCLEPGVLFSASELARPYASTNSFGTTYGEHRRALEFDRFQHEELRDHAAAKGVTYTVSAWDPVSLAAAKAIGFEWIKLPSACATWLDLVRAAAVTFDRIVLSTGGLDRDGLLNLSNATWCDPPRDGPWWALLQCTSAYPCPFEAMDLRTLSECGDIYDMTPDAIGLSGHHRGVAVDCAAVALGARIIERHFTLARDQKGSDHAAALEPRGLQVLVRDIKATEAALGSFDKRVHECEAEPMRKLRTARMR